jgi:hypothetical protein
VLPRGKCHLRAGVLWRRQPHRFIRRHRLATDRGPARRGPARGLARWHGRTCHEQRVIVVSSCRADAITASSTAAGSAARPAALRERRRQRDRVRRAAEAAPGISGVASPTRVATSTPMTRSASTGATWNKRSSTPTTDRTRQSSTSFLRSATRSFRTARTPSSRPRSSGFERSTGAGRGCSQCSLQPAGESRSEEPNEPPPFTTAVQTLFHKGRLCVRFEAPGP